MTSSLFEVENIKSGEKYGPFQARSGIEAIELAATTAAEGQRQVAKPSHGKGEWRAIWLMDRNGKTERSIASETDTVALNTLGLPERIKIAFNRAIGHS